MDGSRFGIKWLDQSRLADLDFADDIALVESDMDKLNELTRYNKLYVEGTKVGLKISIEKTKLMQIG